MSPDYKAGDHVLIGEFGRVHWEVVSAGQFDSGERFVMIRSPMSNRTVVKNFDEIRPWRP